MEHFAKMVGQNTSNKSVSPRTHMRAVYEYIVLASQTDSGHTLVDVADVVALIANIPDSQLSGSSFVSAQFGYSQSRLHTQPNDDGNGGVGAWRPQTNTVGEYIQADFGQTRRIHSVATQGRVNSGQRVTSYKLAYSTDGATYAYVANADGSDRVFGGNSNPSGVVQHNFDVLDARFVRLYPQTSDGGAMAMRWEVYRFIDSG